MELPGRFILVLVWMMSGLPGVPMPGAEGGSPPDDPVSQATAAGMKEGDALLVYCISDSGLLIRGYTRSVSLEVRQSVDSLFWRCLAAFRSKLSGMDCSSVDLTAEIMSRYFIDPVRELIAEASRIHIFPGLSLSGVPFEAFYVSAGGQPGRTCSRQFLVEGHEIIYHTDLPREWTSLPVRRVEEGEPVPGPWFAGFAPGFAETPGICQLPASVAEVDSISRLLQRAGYDCRFERHHHATKRKFLEQPVVAGIVHLATHHVAGKGPGSPGGLLFPAGRMTDRRNAAEILTPEDLAGWKLNAGLVVLNGCGTGRHHALAGGGITSLPQQFLAAGAKQVISTLWNVSDSLACEFMVEFYRQVLSGKSYSRALQAVKISWIGRPDRSIPGMWAGYVLTE